MTKSKILIAIAALALLLSFAQTSARAETGTPAPGVFVMDLNMNPNPPRVGNTFTFTPSFQNTASDPLNFRWRVLIYRADTPSKSYTDTTWTPTSFPTGASALTSLGGWVLPSGTACDYYYATVVWLDANNNQVPFMKPDGTSFQKGFSTCPPLTVPGFAGGIPPGVFVTDLKLSPDPIRVGNTFTFSPSFQNTASTPLNFNWRVLIYRADTPFKSYTDTTWTPTSFPTGASSLNSMGQWVVPPGTACDYYYATVVWQDANNAQIPFMMPDGTPFQKGFTTCP
jgi:hypothetical protein